MTTQHWKTHEIEKTLAVIESGNITQFGKSVLETYIQSLQNLQDVKKDKAPLSRNSGDTTFDKKKDTDLKEGLLSNGNQHLADNIHNQESSFSNEEQWSSKSPLFHTHDLRKSLREKDIFCGEINSRQFRDG